MTAPTTVDQWYDAFAALDQECPWPGPRPLAEEDLSRFGDAEQLLIGREDDRRDFLREIDTGHRLMFLTGASGVGKTSLLQVGLVPTLRENGYVVAVCRDWTRDDRSASPAQFLATKVREVLADTLPSLSPGPDLFWELDERGEVVIVLDQFEELLRWDRPMQRGLFDLISELNHATEIKFVVSFRSEFLHDMRPLESAARAFTMSHFSLDPVDPACAAALIEGPNQGGREVVTGGAAAAIAEYWRDAVRRAPEVGDRELRGGVGLLHLQALLYALHAAAGGGVVTQDVVNEFVGALDPVALFASALARAAQAKLDRCREASTDGAVDVDDHLLEGTTETLARAVRHLSSAGYKLVREVVELAEATLGDQLTSLVESTEDASGKLARGQLAALVATVVDAAFADGGSVMSLLRADAAELAARADERLPSDVPATWARRVAGGSTADDPTGASSGAMLGMPAGAVLVEEARRFAFALTWLSASSLVRVSRPGRETMVALVHDGFGYALGGWSSDVLSRPSGTLHALTAPRGTFLRWPGWTIEPGKGDTGPALLVNVRWRGNTVTADFRHVAFVNCDLRGTLFLGCRLQGVTFVNCQLDGAMLSDCVVSGEVDAAAGEFSSEEPSFVVGAPARDLAALADYRRIDGRVVSLYSPAFGKPARPVASVPGDAPGFLGHAPTTTGGLVFLGGRMSSFTIRRCQIEAGSAIAFRHVAGSGLDIVDSPAGAFEFFGSALRHVSFSTRVASREGDAVEIRAEKSLLAQTWIGDGVAGTFSAHDCRLIHVWNASETMTAVAADSTTTGCVDVADPDDSCKPIGQADTLIPMTLIDASDDFRRATSRMDYQAV